MNLATPDNDERALLRLHFEAVASFSQLNQKARNDFLSWIERSRPFRDIDDLRNRLQQSKLKGFKSYQQRAIVDSLRLRFSRRPFLAAFSTASLISLAAGLSLPAHETHGAADQSNSSLRLLVSEIQQRRQTVGRVTFAVLQQQQTFQADGLSKAANWEHFLHALDMSNWMNAAACMKDTDFLDRLRNGVTPTVLSPLLDGLHDLHLAWDYLLSTREQWEQDYFVGYAFGKMAALAAGTPDGRPFPSYDRKAEKHAEVIHGLASLFHPLEVLNQRFQQPGETTEGAPIRSTQGHNYSYAHIAADLQNRDSVTDEPQTVLVNWDAHADLSEPFENPRMPVDAPFVTLEKATTYAEKVVVASSMSIAGWILPLVYQGLLTSGGGPARVVWVVPKEAQETSHNYMEAYGKYSFVVGDWSLPASLEKIAEMSTTAVGDWNQPGSREIRRFSARKTLQSVTQLELLNNQQQAELYIVDPENRRQLSALLDGVQIVLSIDADFAGTREPGVLPRRGYLPHYPLTESAEARARHDQLLQRLSDFCQLFVKQIRAVTIANSPNFTAAEESRQPVSKILRMVAGKNLANQPGWLQREAKPPGRTASGAWRHSPNSILSAGGLVGLGAVAGILTRDWRRLRVVRKLLFEESKNSSSQRRLGDI